MRTRAGPPSSLQSSQGFRSYLIFHWQTFCAAAWPPGTHHHSEPASAAATLPALMPTHPSRTRPRLRHGPPAGVSIVLWWLRWEQKEKKTSEAPTNISDTETFIQAPNATFISHISHVNQTIFGIANATVEARGLHLRRREGNRSTVAGSRLHSSQCFTLKHITVRWDATLAIN